MVAAVGGGFPRPAAPAGYELRPPRDEDVRCLELGYVEVLGTTRPSRGIGLGVALLRCGLREML